LGRLLVAHRQQKSFEQPDGELVEADDQAGASGQQHKQPGPYGAGENSTRPLRFVSKKYP
jgi:hypothetical protein